MILRFLLALLLIPSLCFAVVNNPLDTTTLSADVITTGTVQGATATLTITATDSITLATTDIITDSVSTRIDSVVLADEATFNLPTSSTGILNIFVEGDNESATCDIQDAGTVTVRSATGSVVNTDTDTNLCIITGANPVVIKNHLGSEKTICYNYLYK